MHDASWCMIRNDLCLTCSIFRGYCRLSKAIQVYPRHQQMHGEAPRHQSEETNCGIIRCVNSHSNRSWTARNSQEWLDSLPFWYRFWDTLKWSNDQTARHMMIPYAIESNIPSSTFLSSWWKWGRIASGHSSTEKTKKKTRVNEEKHKPKPNQKRLKPLQGRPLLGQRPPSRRRSRRLQAAEHICW